tara:strand:+ start:205 stop:507 length:303 start_codon:yes stop_codon:yes gene_type:complete
MAIPFPPGQERAELSRFVGSFQEHFKNLWTRACQFDSIEVTEGSMTTDARLASLHRLHQQVEQELAEALFHKSTDDSDIKKLKLRKLVIKQQMEKLQLLD